MTEEQQLRMQCISMLSGQAGGTYLLVEAQKLFDFVMTGEIPPPKPGEQQAATLQTEAPDAL